MGVPRRQSRTLRVPRSRARPRDPRGARPPHPVGPFLARGTALAPNGKLIALDVYAATITSGTLALREHAQVQWVTADELAHFDWVEADIPSIPAVRAHLLALSGSPELP